MALPKTTDPSLPSIGGLGYIGEPDADGAIVVASGVYARDASGKNKAISPTQPLPVVQTGALPSGTAVIGKVSIDQTTPGTTNAVDVSDRAARAMGKTGIQVGGLDVSAANPMPQSDANTLSGLASERPAAAAGNKGKTYWSLDTGDVSVSTGAAWRTIGVV